MKVAVVIPTVTGRETVFERVLDAYADTRPTGWEFDITVPEDHPTVGEAWNAGATDVDADYVFFAIDDLEPHRGWAQVAALTVDAGYVPAPRQEFPDGSLESCGSLGFGIVLPECPDKTPCRNAGVLFMRPEWYEETGGFLPIHYSCDDDYSWRLALAGHTLLYRSGMRFTHHHEQRGTLGIRANAKQHHQAMIDHAATLQLPERLVPA